MSKEILNAQKTNYEEQYKNTETRLGQLTDEVQRVTVQREQLRGAIYAIDQVLLVLDTPPEFSAEKEESTQEERVK